MYRRSDDVAHEQVGYPHSSGREGSEHGEEVCPEEDDAGDFKVEETVPFCFEEEEGVRVGVEVEAGEGEDDKVEFVPVRCQRVW